MKIPQNKILKKKKGSAFVTVIVISSILAITGTTILTVTASDYKMRKVESERLKNLYEADSGLNSVENIIIKAAQSAIKASDEKIKNEFYSLTEGERTPAKLNERFKGYFYDYLNKGEKITKNNVEVEIPLLEYLIVNNLYIDESTGSKLVYEPTEFKEDAKIEIGEDDYKYNEFNDEGIQIKVKSTFETKYEYPEEASERKITDLKNQKIVEASFKVIAPKYDVNISQIGIYPVFDNKVFTVDENLEVSEGVVTVNGDVWVKGKNPDENIVEYAFDKYEGGVLLNETTLNLTGNLYTANSLNLKNKVKNSSITGDVYANNLYVGRSSREILSDSNNITITKDLILNNDLALNSTNSTINVAGNFYGINDKEQKEDGFKEAMDSSSIIVNETLDTSSINIEKDSYIMGVAYLDVSVPYQTGESVAVKGNYLAYTDPSELDKVTLKYYSPLQLLESKEGDRSLEMKADYFVDYYNGSDTTYELKDGGVNLKGEVYSVGAYIKNGSAIGRTMAVADTKTNLVINKKQEDFALGVLAMMDSNVTTSLTDAYNNKTLLRTVSDQINFSEIERLGSTLISKEGVSLLLYSGTEDLKINNNKIINEGLLNGLEINEGLIISNSNIVITGDFNFKGTIITLKNLNIEGSGNKVVSYDSEVIRKVLASNENLLKNIFITINSNKKAEEIKIITDTNIYKESNFFKVMDWKIIK